MSEQEEYAPGYFDEGYEPGGEGGQTPPAGAAAVACAPAPAVAPVAAPVAPPDPDLDEGEVCDPPSDWNGFEAEASDEACAPAPTEAAQPPAEGAAPRRRPLAELTRREIGDEGERRAASHLYGRGWTILERNWRCKYGEVDIVAQDDETDPDHESVVLVEVKTRLALGASDVIPELAVDSHKRNRYRILALTYLSEHPEVERVRFDVIAINIVSETKAKLRHIPAAFTLEER